MQIARKDREDAELLEPNPVPDPAVIRQDDDREDAEPVETNPVQGLGPIRDDDPEG
jgi:hypothetical protein